MKRHSNWYWLKEFAGDAIGICAIGWSAMMFGGIATVGYARFVEPNLWILYTEIALVALWGIVVAERLVDDIIRFGEER